MLFQQKIEDQMKTVTQEDCRKEQDAADKWRHQHEERQMHRTGTPEKDASGKSGIGSRIRMTVRRMTTKDAGSMEKIREDGAPVEFNDRESTASSDNEEDQQEVSRSRYESDNESIDHSDVDELVRWVSRRDPPSDGERRKGGGVVETKEDSGHESLGQSDVDELVRYASRKSAAKETPTLNDRHTGYSDASTESDSELKEMSSEEEEDADLVRWISHRNGSKAGPVRRNLQRPELDSDVGEHYDSDVPELGRWFKRHDGTSGESTASTPVKETFNETDEEEARGRPRSRESNEPMKEKRHITEDDVDELVRWVSRKDIKQPDAPISRSETSTDRVKREEDEKLHQIGMSIDDGSLSQADLQDLVEHARKKSGDAASSPPPAPFGAETGDLRVLRDEKAKTDGPDRDSQRDLEGQRESLDKKKQDLGMSTDDESLSQSDVADLIAHVKKN
jgi:hypothetical protein